MEDRTLKAMISGYMKSAAKGASFGWQGGEPLLTGIDFFKRVVAYQQKYGLSGQLVSNNLQTNGLLLTKEWASFFRQYRFFIGVSLDGPEQEHNRYRCSANGEDCYGRTMEGIRILREEQVEFGILTVVNDVTAKRPADLYRFFINNGFSRLQFIPCVERDAVTGELTGYSVTAEEYRDFLCILFDVWYNNGEPAASIRLFENILAIGMGIEPEICSFKDRCGSYMVVEYNGDVYPCDFFVEEQWLLGNLVETPIQDLVRKRKRRDFNNRKMEPSSGCKACEWNVICHFGCQHYRSALGENLLCEAYREFFRYTGRRFDMLRENYRRWHS